MVHKFGAFVMTEREMAKKIIDHVLGDMAVLILSENMEAIKRHYRDHWIGNAEAVIQKGGATHQFTMAYCPT